MGNRSETQGGPASRSATRVLLVNHSGALSGAELSLLYLAQYLPAEGFEPLVLAPCEGRMTTMFRREEVPVQVAPLVSVSIRRPDRILAVTVAVWRAIKRWRAQVIHANSFHAVKLVLLAAKATGTPLVGSVRDLVPFTALTRRAVFSCDRVLCVSRAVADNLCLGASTQQTARVTVLPNGVPEDRFARPQIVAAEARWRLGIEEAERPVVGVVAPLVPWKGQAHFLEAARLIAVVHRSASFVLVGDEQFSGPDHLAELQAIAQSPDLAGRVRFLGFREDVPEVLAALDIVVCPSLRPDPFPRAVIEAMMAGRAVVGAAHGGIPEALTDGVTGMLYPPGDSVALAGAVLNLATNEALRTGIGVAAARAARERFTAEAHARAVADEYRQVLREDHGRKRRVGNATS